MMTGGLGLFFEPAGLPRGRRPRRSPEPEPEPEKLLLLGLESSSSSEFCCWGIWRWRLGVWRCWIKREAEDGVKSKPAINNKKKSRQERKKKLKL